MVEARGLEVVAVAADVGQGGDPEVLRERALAAGALDALVVDARNEYADRYLLPALRANARYQGKYPLVSALSRPLICDHLVRAARQFGARYVAHGCTGKGNDQVRFEVSLGALAPDLEVLAPVRDWGWTREETAAYGEARGRPVRAGARPLYSIDENLWGRAIECGALEDPMAEAPDDVWERTVDPAKAPTDPDYVTIGFERGVPVSIDGAPMGFAAVVRHR